MKIIKNLITYILIFVLALTVQKSYGQVPVTDIVKAAKNYIKADELFKSNKISDKKRIKKITDDNKEILAYVIELNPEGFLVFSSSKDLYPVVTYSEKGNFNYMPSKYNTLLALILTDMECQNATLNGNLTEKQKELIKRNNTAWQNLIENKNLKSKYDYEYGPNLPDIWGGVNCIDDNSNSVYVGNYFTPNHYSPGCVATSMSQILHLFEWPPVGQGEHTDNDNSGSSQSSYYAGFGRMWYDWDNMLDEYYGKASNDTERRAMGRIAYHCGVAVDMDYENNGSTSNVNRTPNALNNYFRSCGHYETASWTNFWPRLRLNIENGYAVQMAITDVSSGAGHANVCDGWRQNIGDDKYYHLNNGWWGTCNAWYRLQVSFSDCGYDAIDGGVFDILPDPMFVDEVERSDTDTKTFTMRWNVSNNFNWEAFELQESVDNGSWVTLSNTITDTFYTRTVPSEGVYKYQVRAKSSGSFYTDSWSETLVVPVEKIVYLNFDGNDSYYLKDNSVNDLDISDKWTIETWFEADSYTSGNYDVILDRKTVFSMYLIDDSGGGGDFAIRFVARDISGNIIASLKSDLNSDVHFQEWIHVAVTRDGTTTKMFINGEKVDESTDADFSLMASTNALNIGARYWSSYQRYFDGRIDEIRISDTARYNDDFCPDRFYRFKRDNDTRVLLHMDAFIGDEIKEYSYNFINPTLRASTNDPGWASSTCPIITSDPENRSICGGSVSFSIKAVQAAGYQWQENDGSGYVNISDGGIYFGATTDTLKISDVTGLDGYSYRCIVIGSSINLTKDCSKPALLTVYPVCTIWNGSTWSNGEPDITMTALIAGNYTLPYDISAKELTILDDDTVKVPPNITLTVQNQLENHGVLKLLSNPDNIPTGALTLYGTQNNYGEMIAQRFFSVPDPGVWGNWHLVSFPFTDNIFVGDVFTTLDYVYKNIEPTYSWQKLAETDFMNFGEAYLIQVTETGGLNTEIKGIFGNGAYSHTLPFTSGTNLGWFLAANPYPSPIDWNASAGWTKTNINSTIYTFDPLNNGGSNQYSAWDGTTGTYSGSRYINSFQGFFVQALADGAILNTDNNVRVKNSDVSNNYLKNSGIEDIVRLEIENLKGKKDEIVVYSGTDESKSLKVFAIDSEAPSVWINETGKNYVIQRFLDTENEKHIELKIRSDKRFKINITEFKNTNFNIYLKNLQTDSVFEIYENESFSIENENDENFELIFRNKMTEIEDITGGINIYAVNNSIVIDRENDSNSEISVFDISGKEYYHNYRSGNKIVIKNIKNGFYIIRIKNKNKETVHKIAVY